MIYDRGDVVILPFPFITTDGVQQKARPALIVSDHSIERRFDDVILAGITSQRIDDIKQTEFIVEEGTDEFIRSGLAKSGKMRISNDCSRRDNCTKIRRIIWPIYA